MPRQTLIKNYNAFNSGVITDSNTLANPPENAVKAASNFEFTATEGVLRRKALDLESGLVGSGRVANNSSLAFGAAKVATTTLPRTLNNFGTPVRDVVFKTFEDKGLVYSLREGAVLGDNVADGTVQNNPDFITNTMRDIAWSPELGLYAAATDTIGTPIVISRDGLNWVAPTNYPSTVVSVVVRRVTWSSDAALFIATGSVNTVTSPDGITWEVYQQPASVLWEGVASSAFINVRIGGVAGSGVETSTDGANWSAQIIANNSWTDIIWAEELKRFVGVGFFSAATGQLAVTSPDGITWTTGNTSVTDRLWFSVAWSATEGRLVAVGSTDYRLASTDGGVTWGQSVQMPENNAWRSITRSEELGLFVAVSSDGINRLATSANGDSWSPITVPLSGWTSVIWNAEEGQFVAVASSGLVRIITSNDGVVWDPVEVAGIRNRDPSQWIVNRGLAVGAIGLPDVAVLYNTSPLVYEMRSSLALGRGARVRDFTGVNDGLAVGQRVPRHIFNLSPAGPGYVAGEELVATNGTLTRRFRIMSATDFALVVDKSLGEEDTAFDGGAADDYTGFTITGVSTGTVRTVSFTSGRGISDAHRYNLINQGWTQDLMDQYLLASSSWPSNSQTWYSGKDGSNNFSPSELDKLGFGTGQSPKGSVLLDPFREDRAAQVPGVWAGAVSNVKSDRGFTTLANFGSRVAMAGASIGGTENTVYISRVLFDTLTNVATAVKGPGDLDFTSMFQFYQDNDPTAELSNALLPDDGLVLPISGAGRIYRLEELANNLLVFAENGVWAIRGADSRSGFTTDTVSVAKVTGARGTAHPRTVVVTPDTIFYWATDGIYGLGVAGQGGITPANVTINRLNNLYQAISPEVRDAAISYHDPYNSKVYWAYSDDPQTPELRNKILVLDLSLSIFYPYTLPVTLENNNAALGEFFMSIDGFAQDPEFPAADGTIPLKVLVSEIEDDAGVTRIGHSIMTFENSGIRFDDYSLWRSSTRGDATPAQEPAAFIETWPDTLGDTTRSKQGIWVFAFMKKTETGWEDIGGGALAPVGTSALTMQQRWDWHDSAAGGKWGVPRNIYRHKRPYIPTGPGDPFDTGASVVETKNKIMGRGRALSLRFDAQQGQDAILYGFSIPYSIEVTP